MARNGSGTYSKVNTFSSGTSITASGHNQNWDDIATEITNSVAADGQTPVTGPLKASNGTAAAPAYSFSSDASTGFYHYASHSIGFTVNGVTAGHLDSTGLTLPAAGTFNGNATGVVDLAVTYPKINRPSTTSRILGSSSVASMSITGAANNGSGLIRLAVADTSSLVTGNSKAVTGVTGTIEANGQWTITVIDATHVDLQASTFTNAWVSGGTLGGGVEELSISTGLILTGNVLTAPATPVVGGFKNLSIKVASNTTVTVAADFVVTTNGSGKFQTTAVSSTVILGTSVAVDALDTGTIATDSWYHIWVIAQANGTTKVIASLRSTADATFLSNLAAIASGVYTYYARIGAVQTIHGSATLWGTWQLGRRAQYVLGLAQTTGVANISNGATGSFSLTLPTYATASVVRFVPPTASEIIVLASTGWANAAQGNISVAPSTAYAGVNSINPPPLTLLGTGVAQSQIVSMLLEGTTIAWCSSNAGAITAFGWVDNI